MIQYPDAFGGIESAVDVLSSTWRSRATARLALFETLGGYTEEQLSPLDGAKRSLSAFWSEIKPLYMRIQHNKCVYCETRLEGKSFATVAWDLEHFRPKGRVQNMET